MRAARRAGVMLLAALAVAACGEELPTEAGGGLLPTGLVRTFSVVLEPDDYLVSDTSLAVYGEPYEVPWGLVAETFEGVLSANIVARMPVMPRAISVINASGVLETDTMPTIESVNVVLRMDTLANTDGASPMQLQVHHIGERWDPASATWTMRVDTTGDRQSWAQAGGTRAGLAGTGLWTRGDSVVMIPVDTSALRIWRDTADIGRGALVSAATGNSRLRIRSMQLRVAYTSELNMDTTVVMTSDVGNRTFVHTPAQAGATGRPRVGGVPVWRSFLTLKPGLDTVTVPCPDVPGCRLRLSEVSINRATLELVPVPAPPGFALEDSLRVQARSVLVSEGVPLVRSPVGDIAGISVGSYPPGRGALPATLQLTVTDLVRGLAQAAVDDPRFRRPPPYLALLPLPEQGTFGLAEFQSRPRLRLVLTVVSENQLR
jgi:hypothetical protein